MGIFNPSSSFNGSLPSGNVSTPSLFFSSDPSTGWYRSTTNEWTWESGGNSAMMSLRPSQIRLAANVVLGWNSSSGDSTGSVIDTAPSRTGPGVVAIGNGTQGDASGSLNCAHYQVAGNNVVGARITGYGTPTGNVNQGSFAAGSITLANLAAGVAQLILDLKTHGLLGT